MTTRGARFLLLSSRPEDDLAALEHAAVARLMGLAPDRVAQVRMEAGPLPRVDLDAWAGVLLGGSPFTWSDDPKGPVQRRVEAEVAPLLAAAIEREVPLLAMCYGVGVVTALLGGTVDRSFAEPVGATAVRLTAEGVADPLLVTTPPAFAAYVGHKECAPVPPPGAVLLATSDPCPVQMYRVGEHAYVTQFHPELDHAGLAARVRAYRHHGYFAPDEAERLVAATADADVSGAHTILRAFAARYGD